jgi:hypothetical protein
MISYRKMWAMGANKACRTDMEWTGKWHKRASTLKRSKA